MDNKSMKENKINCNINEKELHPASGLLMLFLNGTRQSNLLPYLSAEKRLSLLTKKSS